MINSKLIYKILGTVAFHRGIPALRQSAGGILLPAGRHLRFRGSHTDHHRRRTDPEMERDMEQTIRCRAVTPTSWYRSHGSSSVSSVPCPLWSAVTSTTLRMPTSRRCRDSPLREPPSWMMWSASPRIAVLAIAHPVDRRIGNRVLHHRPAAITCRRTDQGVCRRGYGSYQDQAASPALHFGKMDMEYLSRAHHRLHRLLLRGRNESLRQFQLCDDHDGYGWFLYPQQQYLVLPFAGTGIHLYVLLLPLGSELHPALCSSHQVQDQGSVQELGVQVLCVPGYGIHRFHHGRTDGDAQLPMWSMPSAAPSSRWFRSSPPQVSLMMMQPSGLMSPG